MLSTGESRMLNFSDDDRSFVSVLALFYPLSHNSQGFEVQAWASTTGVRIGAPIAFSLEPIGLDLVGDAGVLAVGFVGSSDRRHLKAAVLRENTAKARPWEST